MEFNLEIIGKETSVFGEVVTYPNNSANITARIIMYIDNIESADVVGAFVNNELR